MPCHRPREQDGGLAAGHLLAPTTGFARPRGQSRSAHRRDSADRDNTVRIPAPGETARGRDLETWRHANSARHNQAFGDAVLRPSQWPSCRASSPSRKPGSKTGSANRVCLAVLVQDRKQSRGHFATSSDSPRRRPHAGIHPGRSRQPRQAARQPLDRRIHPAG